MPRSRPALRSPLPAGDDTSDRAPRMNQPEAIELLEKEWHWPDGFFARLHAGDFSARGARRLLDVITALELEHDSAIDRRLVAQLWGLPLHVERRLPRVGDQQGDVEGCRGFIAEVTRLLEEKLGVP
jgi:hypothetical protein